MITETDDEHSRRGGSSRVLQEWEGAAKLDSLSPPGPVDVSTPETQIN